MATAMWIVAGLLLLIGLFGIWRQHAPFSWQPVPARIVEQRLDREQDITENVGGALGGVAKALQGTIESDAAQRAPARGAIERLSIRAHLGQLLLSSKHCVFVHADALSALQE